MSQMCDLKIVHYAACGHTVNHNLQRCEFDIAIHFLSEEQIMALYPSWLFKYFYDRCMLSKDAADYLADRTPISCPDCKAARVHYLEASGYGVLGVALLSTKDNMTIRDVERVKSKGAFRQRIANWILSFKEWRHRKVAEYAVAKARKAAEMETKKCRCNEDKDLERDIVDRYLFDSSCSTFSEVFK